ncbi:MAG: polyphosphate kinase 2 family protein [Micrococcus sp.]|nr:polyphosphate kinase 2 family protein [Micrococcus sp.]
MSDNDVHTAIQDALPSDLSERGTPAPYTIPTDWKGDVAMFDARATPGFDGAKKDGHQRLAALGEVLDDHQERLFAAHHVHADREPDPGRSILLVIQGMDTSGKGGILRHVLGAVDPQGVKITAFKAPTDEEKKHDFLWRIKPRTPAPGYIGVFDRSHYEDVLIHRVHGWADEEEIERRCRAINRFEKDLVEGGTTVVKVMLHISQDEQGERLMSRLDRPHKHWKFAPSDIDERKHWSAYMDAYSRALRATSTEHAPWHVVPANRKWFSRIVVQQLLLDALAEINPQWPTADFDVEGEKRRLRSTIDAP